MWTESLEVLNPYDAIVANDGDITKLPLHQIICYKLTKHKICKCVGYDYNSEKYYYRCKLCGYGFWSKQKPKKLIRDLEW